MKKNSTAAIIFLLLLIVPASAQYLNQKSTNERCRGPIYTSQEVTRRAKLTPPLDIRVTEQARANDVHGRIIIEAVLCRSGRVTDLRVVEGLPYGMTESTLEAVRRIRFTPAEMNWHTVSQRQRFEFGINERGIVGIAPAVAAGRPVEAVDVVGNRRLTKSEILASVRTRPGEPYNSDQVTQDLNAILATGYFDKLRSRVSIEDGLRGGVAITFEVVELPLIQEVNFVGVAGIEPSVMLDALRARDVDLSKGARYDLGRMKLAIQVIKETLASRGLPNAKVDLQVENVTATAVTLTFVISNQIQYA